MKNDKVNIHLTETFLKDEQNYNDGFKLLTHFIVENRLENKKEASA